MSGSRSPLQFYFQKYCFVSTKRPLFVLRSFVKILAGLVNCIHCCWGVSETQQPQPQPTATAATATAATATYFKSQGQARIGLPGFACHFAARVAQKKWQLDPVTGPGGLRGLRGPASEISVCHFLPSPHSWKIDFNLKSSGFT